MGLQKQKQNTALYCSVCSVASGRSVCGLVVGTQELGAGRMMRTERSSVRDWMEGAQADTTRRGTAKEGTLREHCLSFALVV